MANESYNFSSYLASIVNRSFAQGIFPEQLKLAKVIPIHKEGSKTKASNYRPISLYEMQYGFRPGRSREHALLDAQSNKTTFKK